MAEGALSVGLGLRIHDALLLDGNGDVSTESAHALPGQSVSDVSYLAHSVGA